VVVTIVNDLTHSSAGDTVAKVETSPLQASWITMTNAFSAVLRGSRNGGKYEP
jgi:hypothetical protein